MELFQPSLSLRRQPDGRYTLQSVTQTPNSCFYAGPAREGIPAGVVVLPEVLPVILEIGRRSGICLQVITPVDHRLQNLDLRPDSGKTEVVAFVVLDGLVVGSASIGPRGGASEPNDAGEAGDRGGEGTCPLGSRAWYSWADRMPPGPASLHVVGQVLAPTPCYEARLTPAAPQGINPKQLILDVSLTPTRKTCPQVLTWLEVRFDEEPYDGQYEEVAIRCGSEIYAVVPIEDVH